MTKTAPGGQSLPTRGVYGGLNSGHSRPGSDWNFLQ